MKLACGVMLLVLAQGAFASVTPAQYQRSESLSYLGMPQWAAAHNAAAYANYIEAGRPASDYPDWGLVAQQWGAYGHVIKATLRDDIEPVMHSRILTGALIETLGSALRSAYEVTVGRLSEFTRGDTPTSEERYAAKVAKDYADFLRLHPWYEFDFGTRLKALWQQDQQRDGSAFGPASVRKWERRYALTSEYAGKAVLAWFTRKFAETAPVATPQHTAVLVDRWVDRIAGNWPEMQRVRSFASGGELVLLPRHHDFKTVAVAIARSGANFVEVAGNGPERRILVSVIVPRGWRPDSEGSASLFEQDMPTLAEQKRVALTVPVRELAQTLRELDGMQITIEQVYDY